MNRYSPFEDYLKWERENVIHLEGTRRVINHSDGRALGVEDQKLVRNKMKSSYCSHCGAPVNPYRIKCEYCECYYEVN